MGKILQTAVAHAFRLFFLSDGAAPGIRSDASIGKSAEISAGKNADKSGEHTLFAERTSLSASDASTALQECFSQHPVWENIIGSLLEGSRMYAKGDGACANSAFAHMMQTCAPAPGVPIQVRILLTNLGERIIVSDQLGSEMFFLTKSDETIC